MLDRERKEKELKSGQSSIAAIRGQFFSNQQLSAPASGQKTTTQKELTTLRAAAEASSPKIDQNPKGSKLAALREQIFAHKPSLVNTQKLVTEQDIKALKAAEGNVRNKAKELEKYFQKSNQALDVLKKNKSSQAARIKLTIPYELKIFTEQQITFINDIRVKLEADIVRYANEPRLHEMEYARFLELSFIYRAYEVCVEQEFRRHAATNVQNNCRRSAGTVDAVSENKENLALLCGIPCKMAVESLNYYEDFYKKLPDIEKIWPDAGVEIRKAEVRLIIAAVLYGDTKNLAVILGDRKTKGFNEACAVFDKAVAQYIRANPFLQDYIVRGDGLNTEKHPYSYYQYRRLPQPNTSINFREIVAIDPVHADAIQQVEQRVAADKLKL